MKRAIVGFRPSEEDERILARLKKLSGSDASSIRVALKYIDKALDREGQLVSLLEQAEVVVRLKA